MSHKNGQSRPGLVTVLVVMGVVFLLHQLSCSDFENNPLDSSYTGNYELSVSFDSLPAALFPFRTYTVPWSDNGTDKFFRLSLSTDPAGNVDTSILLSRKPDPLPVRFTGPFNGKLVVVGVRPNEVNVDFPFDVHVVNPYRITVDSSTLSGASNIKLFVTDSAAEQSDSSLDVVWFIDGTRADSLPYNTPLSHDPQTSSSFWAKAIICDFTGAKLQLDSIRVQIQQRPQPKIVIQDLTLNAPQGKPFTITASITNADSVRWQSKVLGKDTTIASSQITWIWTGATSDTVIATAKNRYGTIGTSDTVIVVPKVFTYDLTVVAFPETAQARKWTTWEVTVTRNGQPVASGEVSYIWTMTGDTTGDSIRTTGGKREMYIANEKKFNLSVLALVGIDSSYRKSVSVTVDANRPVLNLSTTELTTPLNLPVSVIVRAMSGDAAATITAVKYRDDSNSTINTLQGDTLRLVYATPGDKHAKIWAEDNLGFASDTSTILVHVTATKPYFQREAIDTTIFINDPIRIDAKAFSGSTGDSVSTWKWDFNDDGTWDKTTSVGYCDTTYLIDGFKKVKIWCANSQGDSSETLAIRNLTILPGKPVLDSAALASYVAYLNRTVGLRIFAHDTNGVVKSLSVSWGQQSPMQILTNKQMVDTTVQLSFATAGTYKFTIAATDEDGQVSAAYTLKDSLIVDQGNPRVKGLRPDTLWFKTDSALVISAEDNGSITGYAVSYDNVTFSAWATDSVFRHTFADSGKQYVYIKAKDDDNNISTVTKDSVFVKAGYPTITGVTLSVNQDSLYAGDTRGFTITATDPNKTVRKIYVNWIGGTAAQDSADVNGVSVSTTIDHAFALADTGSKSIKVWCKDDDGLLSQVATKVVQVKAGYPSITGVTLSVSEDSLFILDSRGFTITATDPNKTVRKIYVNWNGGATAQDSASVNGAAVNTTINHAFAIADSGARSVRVWCRDEEGLLSNVTTKSLNVRVGRPKISGVSRDSAMVFIGDPVRFTLSAADTNGTIAKALADWNGDGTADDSATVSGSNPIQFTRTFSAASVGLRTIKYWVRDDDGLLSNVFNDTVTVRLGKPSVVSITPDSTIFINDARQFAIATYDTNGTVDSIKIDNGSGAFGGFIKITNGAYTLNRTFTRSEAGTRTIRIIAKDNDLVLSDTATLQVTVQLGAPQIDSIRITNVIGNNFFVKDNNTFRVYVSDPNGTPKKIFAAWKGGSSPDDSISITIGSSGYGEISHLYDTSSSGNQTVKFWVADDDTVRSSTSKDTTILVRKGAPVLWGDGVTRDTLYIVVNNGYRDYYYRPYYADTNGTIQKFYFGSSADTAAAFYKGPADSTVLIIDDININKVAANRYIYGKDDDDLLRGGRFVVFADSAPRPITGNYSDGQLKFQWSGIDAVDSLSTMYRILVKKGSQLQPEDTTASFIAKDWSPANDPAFSYTPANPLPFTWSYVPTGGTGLYYYQIIAKDRRGTRSATQLSGTNFFTY